MKKRVILLFIVFLTELFAIHKWFSCWLFQSPFYFTHQTLVARLTEATNLEGGVPLLEVRLFNNKVFMLPWGISQALLQYWDIRFLEVFIGVVGAVGVYLGIWYFFTRHRKNSFLWVLFLGLIIFCCVEIFHPLPFQYGQRILPIAGVFGVFSLFGIWQFLKYDTTQKRFYFIIILLLLAVLSFLFFPLSYQNFCLKV